MAKISNWSDDYWLFIMQLYLRKPVGVKPLYSKQSVDLSIELHIPPSVIHSRLQAVAGLATPRIEKIWNTYSRNPAKLTRAVRLLRSMKGFGSALEFYDGVETNETFERDFRPVSCDSQLTPAMLIMILDLYFRLSTITMVADTPEVVELSKLLRIKPQKTAEVLQVMQYCDPYLNRKDVIFNPLLEHCQEVWQRYGNSNPDALSALAEQLREYFV